MLYFSETFVQVVIVGALLFAGVAAVTLIILLINDKQKNKVW